MGEVLGGLSRYYDLLLGDDELGGKRQIRFTPQPHSKSLRIMAVHGDSVCWSVRDIACRSRDSRNNSGMDYLWVGLGSALGGMARHWISLFTLNRYGAAFPWGTMAVNVLGSFAIGFIASLAAQGRSPFGSESVQRFVLVGLLGGFTTFSSFSLQTIQLFERGQGQVASLNIIGSVICCLFAAWLGLRAGRLLLA